MYFDLREGDGNEGNYPAGVIEAADLDAAVEQYLDGCSEFVREHADIDGDDLVAYVTVYEGPDGQCAINTSAWFTAEIRPAR